MRYLLDTNICIYVIREKPEGVIRRFRRLPVSSVAISSITLSELEYGVEKSSRPVQNRFALLRFLAPLEILPYGADAARVYGRIRAHLERQGTPIGALDTLIAAQALSAGCALVTNNEREFRRVPGLRVENWAA
ncbi:type II toxin-antitoxin system tRNA(fMet)-specific endonuclease VapC [Deferrisoma camini]|uniref:type II toxin-antitoxin system tRNA(fMet)-specific endonuclease VapC n=1 Tax=Deferrisoma camini TaxID=1035120 RepID=UPI00046D4679